MIAIKMPQVGQDYPSGMIVEWLKQENDPVQKGEVVLRVESEKATFGVEADTDGILLKILHDEGAEVDILKPVGYIGQPGEAVPDIGIPEGDACVSQGQDPVFIPSTPAPPITPSPGKREISPAAKSAAVNQGIDWTEIKGSGPGGRIIKRDIVAVSHAEDKPGSLSPQDQVIPFSRMRQKIAERLTLSKKTIPHFYLTIDVDVTGLLMWRQEMNQAYDERVSVTDLIVRAVAHVLPECPELNAHVASDRIILKKDIHIGLAVSVDEGLLVPVIPFANQKNLSEIARTSRQIAVKAREGSVNPSPPGTFTVSTLGMYSIKSYLPIINPPECAILAIGAAEKRVVPVADKIEIRDIMSLTLAADHRGVDGVEAARFLNRVKNCLEDVQSDRTLWVA
jgi:pyruvate dehydrogenase E2 component (dihydrolipoamide acetyltransferase)